MNIHMNELHGVDIHDIIHVIDSKINVSLIFQSRILNNNF
jgi:hypothetical protein